jgi:hypothetical protein
MRQARAGDSGVPRFPGAVERSWVRCVALLLPMFLKRLFTKSTARTNQMVALSNKLALGAGK